MKIDINPKLKPLYANLLRQGMGRYLISIEFSHFIIENNLDQIWDACNEYVKSLSSYTVLAPGYTGYAEDALGVFLSELSKAENTFIEILGSILINFAAWSPENIDFSKIKKDIIDLGYNEDEFEGIFSQISKKNKKYSIQNALARIAVFRKKRKKKTSTKKERAWYKDPKIIIPSLLMILLFIGGLSWPYIQDELWGMHPDTYICVIGMDDSSAFFPSNDYKLTLKPIKFPSGVSTLDNLWIPVQLYNWTYSKNAKYYSLLVHNRGDGTAKNVKIKIDFDLIDSIKSVEISHEDRIEIIEGGITGSYIVFRIPELLPDEKQNIEILINHKNFESIKVWSETEGDVKNIYIFDIIVEVQ